MSNILHSPEELEDKFPDLADPNSIWEKVLKPEYLADIHAQDKPSEIEMLRREIATLRMAFQRAPIQIKIVEYQEDVDIETAKGMIEDYLEKVGKAYPSDISEALKIPLKTTVEALEKLEESGSVLSKS